MTFGFAVIGKKAEIEPLSIGLAEVAPVRFRRGAPLAKVPDTISDAPVQGCAVVDFRTALVRGYPNRAKRTGDGAFDNAAQKESHA